MDNLKIIECVQKKGRKKLVDRQNWKREKSKLARYSAKNLPLYPQCGHNGKRGQPFQCTNKNIISLTSIRDFHRNFYASKNKVDQDCFILKYCKAKVPKRRKKCDNEKPKNVSIKYFIRRSENGSLAPVCRMAFLSILGLGKDRVINVVRNHLNTGIIPKEKRGGDRIGKKNEEKRLKVMAFIESLTCTESHYSRQKNINRIYLPCELNITKLWRMFNAKQEENLKVKLCFFRKIFNTKYNIGFGSPKTDVCSTCIQFKEKMKSTLTPKIKSELICHQRVHKLRAKCFYELLKEEQERIEIFSFDCEKNLALPKLPDQACYFSMQLNLYNFTMVHGPSATALNKHNVTSFLWSEVDRQKSSNEIASAVFYKLCNHTFNNVTEIVRLMADGCAGQNKNSIIVGMCMYWLKILTPQHIMEIQLIFPVVGHSFIPPDRVFGQIEKEIKKTSTIVSPYEYIRIIKKYCTVLEIQKDYPVLDFKSKTESVLKATSSWHFQISKVKRIIISKSENNCSITVRGEPHYRNDIGTAAGILKREKQISQIQPENLIK